nr:MAG TPA: hypothetical protein [Crassvirales sp.]
MRKDTRTVSLFFVSKFQRIGVMDCQSRPFAFLPFSLCLNKSKNALYGCALSIRLQCHFAARRAHNSIYSLR